MNWFNARLVDIRRGLLWLLLLLALLIAAAALLLPLLLVVVILFSLIGGLKNGKK